MHAAYLCIFPIVRLSKKRDRSSAAVASAAGCRGWVWAWHWLGTMATWARCARVAGRWLACAHVHVAGQGLFISSPPSSAQEGTTRVYMYSCAAGCLWSICMDIYMHARAHVHSAPTSWAFCYERNVRRSCSSSIHARRISFHPPSHWSRLTSH